jgi:nicotinamidase-related amidase
LREPTNGRLIERERSCLIVVDVQQYFLDKLPPHERGPLVQRMAWLMRVACALGIPLIATAEDVERNGPLVSELAGLLPAGTAAYNKMIFGLMSQPDIRAAVDATKRDCFVLVGLATDVCIAHSALGLSAAGHRAVVIDDACASPPPHHDHGLRRLRDAGIAVTSVKGIFYEWIRDLETYHRLKPELNVALPEGLTL